jgi:mevalonate kinase
VPAISASAPGKIILLGEHAVVYGQPAIAVPLDQVRAKAIIKAEPRSEPGEIRIQAPDIGLESSLGDLPAENPLAKTVRIVLTSLEIDRPPALTVRITSTIPQAAGLGSGTAVSVALIRALSGFLGHHLPNNDVSNLAFEVEKIYHGTPSGIDNTVITYDRPIYYQKPGMVGPIMDFLSVQHPFSIVIGDTGIPSLTAETVADVRKAWFADREGYEKLFSEVGEIVKSARNAIEKDRIENLGELMDANQALLEQLGVSSAALEDLVRAARSAGALGAKLSGGGRGGNMIALTTPENAPGVSQALREAGAVYTTTTMVSG